MPLTLATPPAPAVDAHAVAVRAAWRTGIARAESHAQHQQISTTQAPARSANIAPTFLAPNETTTTTENGREVIDREVKWGKKSLL
jgi:hypothetical protein